MAGTGGGSAQDAEIARLRAELAAKECRIQELEKQQAQRCGAAASAELTAAEVRRYSRQVILTEVQPAGQRRLLDATVLLVGAGGLASSCGPYLAAAGVGRLIFADFDVVETSNLHRQVMHTTAREGVPKALSARETCLSINPEIRVDAVLERFTADNGVQLVSAADVVVDCTDNITARYLVSDACVIAKKPLVSGSALRWEGQATVYNYEGGPCYRCAYPKPPPLDTVGSCADGGVAGAVPGMIGCVQALEAQKVLLRAPGVMSGRLLMYNAWEGTWTVMRGRRRNAGCAACGDSPSITALRAYDEYICKPCERGARPLPPDAELSVVQLSERLRSADEAQRPVVVDVRPPNEYSICRLAGSVHVPLSELPARRGELEQMRRGGGHCRTLAMLCRRGVSSAEGTQRLLDLGVSGVVNVTGGLTAWQRDVDPCFPIY
eukprot:TRINITY_DN23631_c0_g1_i1.p1 TRINITY_DN23631_c0_g1~~TRINITY_DN23631_c0_g1_i1.p1  ORF type:complete len:437 (+),score=100.60 TRINITY_DN23631_c0_g1_i1:87-1397(+)